MGHHKKGIKPEGFGSFFYILMSEIRSRPLRKRSGGAFLGRSVAETLPENVDTRFEMEDFS